MQIYIKYACWHKEKTDVVFQHKSHEQAMVWAKDTTWLANCECPKCQKAKKE